MSSQYRSILRLCLGLAMAFLAALPIRAQLDPRLQSSKTDFMDLYQQSSSLKAKPEIVTVFDYSRSMASLMFHPLYRNDDVADQDDYRYMKFQLTGGSGGTPANNVWWVIAFAGNDPGSTVTGDGGCRSYGYITVNNGTPSFYTFGAQEPTCRDMAGNNVCTINTGSAGSPGSPGSPGNNQAPWISFYAQSAGNGNAYTRIWFAPDSTSATQGANDHTSYHVAGNSSNGTFGNPSYTMSVLGVNPSGSVAPGQTVTLTATLTHPFSEGEDISHKVINWGYDQGWLGFSGFGPPTQISSGVYQSTATIVIPDFVHAPDNPPTPPTPDTRSSHPGDYTKLAPITATLAGGVWTFKTYYEVQGTGANNDKINWIIWPHDTWNICPGAWPQPFRGGQTQTTSGTTLGSATDIRWDGASWCNGVNTGSTDPYVTVWLDASQGSSYNSGIPYVGPLSGNTIDQGLGVTVGTEVLRKPDGSQVKAADAITAGGLNGSWAGAGDVRNWLRAASHVRFKNGTRTIDIPLAWKIMDGTSTAAGGNPLSSTTVLDQQIRRTYATDGTPIDTTWGSGTQIELDKSYKVENDPGSVFTQDTNGNPVDNSPWSTVYLYNTLYRPAYISWLFNGKYQSADSSKSNYTLDGSLAGNYVAFDALNVTAGGGFPASGQTNAGWGAGFGNMIATDNAYVPQYNLDGTYKSSGPDLASKYRTPALTRLQATKSAAIRTWIAHQGDVFWAFRCLDPVNEALNGTGTTIGIDSRVTYNGADATTTHVNGNDSGWKVLNNTAGQGINSLGGNSVSGMARIASLFANSQTPLTYSVAGALAQFNDPNSVLNDVVGLEISQCVPQFLLLFTDGVDNNGQEGSNNTNNTTPYISVIAGVPTLDAKGGNLAIIADTTSIDRSGSNWNFFTMMGIAAHLSDPSFGINGTDFMSEPTSTSLQSLSPAVPHLFLPFAVNQRNGVTYDKDHRVTVMTVGVSLGGQYTDPASPKRSLFVGAVVGDPATNTGRLDSFHSFVGWEQPQGQPIDPNNDWIPDPQDPTSYPLGGVKKSGAVFFFDATDPAKLELSMDFAFRLALGQGGNNATSSPNLPFTGSSLGKQVYLGNFNPPKNGGVMWPGDLLMFGTLESKGVIHIIDKNANWPTSVHKANAQWSASDALAAKLWTSRTLYTRLPGNATNAERGPHTPDGYGYYLHAFTDIGAAYLNVDAADNTAGLKNYVAVPTLPVGGAAQKALIQYAAGGNTLGALDVNGRPTTNRLNIMGDIIDSAPAPLEYNWNDVQGLLGAYPRLSAVAAAGGNRFRIILVGTNQGWLHAFGEVTRTITVNDNLAVPHQIVTGDVEELWSFMPTDFLTPLKYISVTNNTHRFMVDGTPAIYFLDMAPATGGSGNGVVDISDPRERAIAVIGLRKGGRSYYALNIKNPFAPTLQWSMVPDEADHLPVTRTVAGGPPLATVQSILKNWGFSTSTPAFGRVQFHSGTGDSIRDAVFLGGGFSVPEVEANFANAKLGRSVMAIDVWSGEVLAASDLTVGTIGGGTIGPIGAGVIPFEYFLASGMAQRAYFLDYKGGLWSWGSKDVVALAGPYKDFRIDTSELTNWQVRKVAQDDNNVASGRGGRYTTLPAPFRVGTFPGVGKTATSAPPTAVGIAMVSGDRNNPLDLKYTVANPAPIHHRLTVVFDRQDSRAWGNDTAAGPDSGIQDVDLKNFSFNVVNSTPPNACLDGLFSLITPGCPSYYLSPYAPGAPPSPLDPKFGYYINFPSIANNFISKGINPPIVVAGSLLYSYFTPTTRDLCTGGTGNTFSWFTTDVMNPIVSDTRTDTTVMSGLKDKWVGVASDYIALGTKAVLQGGTVGVNNPLPGADTTIAEIHTTLLPPTGKYPKVRVWRTVH